MKNKETDCIERALERAAGKHAVDEHGRDPEFMPDRVYARCSFKAGTQSARRVYELSGRIEEVKHHENVRMLDEAGAVFLIHKRDCKLCRYEAELDALLKEMEG